MKGKNVSPKDVVLAYLQAKAKDDVLFSEMLKKENKTFDACWAYIVNAAKSRGNAVCMTDDEVFGLAVHYYCEDDLKNEPMPKGFNCKMSSSENVELSEEDKARLRREAEADFKAKVMKQLEAVEKKEAERKAEIEKKKAAKAESKRLKTAGMGCLFDF